ncbi:MAG: YidC/Oxa1 family membrane protein insertase [Coriobacteriales bacterium]|nr:YidC/Oxa1 family membrane protein insertase [Coriobacteriales bacterium]
MEFINAIIGAPLGVLMHWCFELTANYGAAILLFTLLTKIILFPLSLIAQKNSIKMVKMAPALEEIKARSGGNKELFAQEQKQLYKQEKYSSWAGILPLLIQIPIILGLICVIYNPLTYLFLLDHSLILDAIRVTSEITGRSIADMGISAELFAFEAIQNNPDAFVALPGMSDVLSNITSLDTGFLGINLTETPSFTSPALIIAILSALSALVLSLVQNRYNVLQMNAGFFSKWGMTLFLVVFSGYFAFVLPCGLGLYWTAGNLLSIPTLMLCNLIYSPKAYMTDEFRIKHKKLSRSERSQLTQQKREQKVRSKQDIKRFFAKDNRCELVFYSESSGFYKYYRGLIEYLIEHSDIVIHYATSDPNDALFKACDKQIVPYFVAESELISFMMRMDADIVVMTMPDLETYHIKRSIANKNIEYIYLDHGFGSFSMVLREHALDHFDTIFCYGPNHIEEIRETEYAYQLPQKTLVKTGFALYDELTQIALSFAAQDQTTDKKCSGEKLQGAPQVLVAPSWQPDNIMDSCLEGLLMSLTAQDFNVVVRPHPEYVKRFPERIEKARELIESIDASHITLQDDFTDNSTLYTSAAIITDWSTVAQEFCLTQKKPAVFINTPMKVLNPNWQKIPAIPLELSLRNELGISLDVDEITLTGQTVTELLADSLAYQDRIEHLLSELLFDVGKGAAGGATYLISKIEYLRKTRQTADSKRSEPKDA